MISQVINDQSLITLKNPNDYNLNSKIYIQKKS